MELISGKHPLIIVVGSGGVGKTTLAASLGVLSAREGRDTLVMTFDPSLRLKQTPGSGGGGAAARDAGGVRRAGHAPRQPARRPPDLRPADRALRAGRGVPPPRARQPLLPAPLGHPGRHPRIHGGRAPVRGRRGRPLRPGGARHPADPAGARLPGGPQARIVGFLDSGALRVALKPWFDDEGRLRAASKLGRPRPAGRALPRRGGGHGPAARHGRVLPGLRPALRGVPRPRPGGGGAAALEADPLRAGHRPRARSASRTPSSSPASWRRPATTSARSW